MRSIITHRSVALVLVVLGVAAVPAPSSARPHGSVSVDLVLANSALLPCLASDDGKTPTLKLTVRRGRRNDHLRLVMEHMKPGLTFDLFTIQHSPLLADGTADSAFAGVGLAWYQSDVRTNRHPDVTEIDTILVDQIFGIDTDASVNLAPTQTLHVGLWFDNPAKAAACGFSGTTPFNGAHNAGPLAFVTKPDATTGLGPLCTDPDKSTVPATCKP